MFQWSESDETECRFCRRPHTIDNEVDFETSQAKEHAYIKSIAKLVASHLKLNAVCVHRPCRAKGKIVDVFFLAYTSKSQGTFRTMLFQFFARFSNLIRIL